MPYQADSIPAGEEIQDRIYRYDKQQLADYLEAMPEQPYRSEDFHLDRLTDDLCHDIQVLEAIQAHLQTIHVARAPKYDELVRQIQALQEEVLV